MNEGTSNTVRSRLCRQAIANKRLACAGLVLMSLSLSSAVAAPADEVRTTFDCFVAAQNVHHVMAVESLLLGSPDFVWITRGTAVWGPDAALKRFASLYEGTWHLDLGRATILLRVRFRAVGLGSSMARARPSFRRSDRHHAARIPRDRAHDAWV